MELPLFYSGWTENNIHYYCHYYYYYYYYYYDGYYYYYYHHHHHHHHHHQYQLIELNFRDATLLARAEIYRTFLQFKHNLLGFLIYFDCNIGTHPMSYLTTVIYWF